VPGGGNVGKKSKLIKKTAEGSWVYVQSGGKCIMHSTYAKAVSTFAKSKNVPSLST